MSLFKELNNYLNDVLLMLVSNQNLCKYLHYDTDSDVDPLGKPDLSEAQRTNLLFDRIFPIPKLPIEKEIKATSYLTVYFDSIEKGGSIYFKDSLLTFNVLCHQDQWRIPDGLRPLAIMDEINSMFDNQTTIGIGKTQYQWSRFFPVNKDFAGYTLTYKLIDYTKVKE